MVAVYMEFGNDEANLAIGEVDAYTFGKIFTTKALLEISRVLAREDKHIILVVWK